MATGWFARPVRQVYYNLTITGLSVFVAFFIGTVEILGLTEQEYRLGGGFWTFMGNFDINKVGFVVVGVFVLTWAVALAVWHFGKIEQKCTPPRRRRGTDPPGHGRDQKGKQAMRDGYKHLGGDPPVPGRRRGQDEAR
jgi:nickel/cobalt transporter (NiCoT) family protein